MSWKELAGKGTWLGMAAAAAVLLVLLGVASLLLLRGVIPESAIPAAAYISAAAACFFGGRIAVRGGEGGTLPRALAVSACVYGAMWLTVLGGDAQVSFGQSGLWLTAAVWGGGTLAGIMGQGKRRRKTMPRGKRRVVDKRRKRAVT